MRQVSQSVAYPLEVFMPDALDPNLGKTGLALVITVRAKKSGGVPATITPVVTETEGGFYTLALTAAHLDTLGDGWLLVSAPGAVTQPILFQVTSLAANVTAAKTRVELALPAIGPGNNAGIARLQDVPTAAQNAGAVFADEQFLLAIQTINSEVHGPIALLDAISTRATQASVDELEPAVTVPVDQVPVPEQRTWIVSRGASGLIGTVPLGMNVGEPDVTFAIDFRNDLANNGRLIDFDSIAILSGTAGGVTFDADLGVDKVQAKVKITAVTAGTYYLKVIVSKDPSDGGGKAIAIVKLIVS